MPTITTAYLRDEAVLWEFNGDYDKEGIPYVSAGIELKCRWEHRTGEIVSPSGETIWFTHALVVSRDIAVGSIMWEGKLTDVGSPPTNLMKVIQFRKIPGLKGRVKLRVVYLMKYSDTLPTIQ